MMTALFLIEMGALAGVILAIPAASGPLSSLPAGILKVVLPLLCLAAGFYYAGLYDLRTSGFFGDLARRIGRALAFAVLPLALLYTLAPGLRLSESLPLSLGSVLLGVAAVSLPLHWTIRRILRSESFSGRVLILGTSPLGVKIADAIRESGQGHVVGFLENADVPAPSGLPAPVLGTISKLLPLIELTRPDRIVVALAERRNRLPARELLEARVRGITVEGGIHAYERVTGKLAIESLTPSYLVFSDDFRISRWNLALKRLTSMAVATVGLALSAPLLPLIALAVKLASEGPVLFVHERVGRSGKAFRLYKFRTMRESASRVSEWERDNEERITPVGRFLRKFRLDELPQFWNILRGDMNIVGPRPHPVTNYELFVREIPYYGLRQSIPPGLTGWAQVHNGYAQDLEGEIDKMRYDLYYISHLSIWMDLKILLKTVKVVLVGTKDRVSDGPVSEDVAPAGSRRTAAA